MWEQHIVLSSAPEGAAALLDLRVCAHAWWATEKDNLLPAVLDYDGS